MPRPSIDHGPLSPSGKVSRRARDAAQERTRRELFPEGYWEALDAEHADAVRKQRPAVLRQQAAELRALADRGMRPRVHRRLAAQLEQEADVLEQDEALHQGRIW